MGLTRYTAVGASNPLDVLDNEQFFNQAKDVDEPDEAGTYSLVCDTGSDGIAVYGTLTELEEWLIRAHLRLRELARTEHAERCKSIMERLRETAQRDEVLVEDLDQETVQHLAGLFGK